MDDVDQLLLNARLRDELEPFLDDSISCLETRRLPTSVENEFLASMLAWERAPVLSISQWFTPELVLPHPDALTQDQLHTLLSMTIQRLYEKRIVLDFTDHLSDRQLYTIIFRDILPSPEKKVDLPRNYLHWDCASTSDDPETWLRYYATDEERDAWSAETGEIPPPAEMPQHRRKMPTRPL
jgi:hypothetical protein